MSSQQTTAVASHYRVFRLAVEQLMQNTQKLPGLPSSIVKIRKAINTDHASHEQLARLIAQDSSLALMVMNETRSPIYGTACKINTLEGATRLLGFKTIERLSVLHGLRSLFVFQKSGLKKLFNSANKRQLFKASLCQSLSRRLRFPFADEAMISSLFSEIGNLSIISALSELPECPDAATYARLCNEFGKSLGGIILKKWDVGEQHWLSLKTCGDWQVDTEASLNLADMVNLAEYHCIALLNKQHQLPALTSLPVYKKIKPAQQAVNSQGILVVVSQELNAILVDTARLSADT